MSAGGHLGLLLASSSQTPAYEPIDKLDEVPCHVNWAILNAPAYVTSDGEKGSRATRQGYGTDVGLSKLFKFDEKTCPICLHHGGLDPYSPNGSTQVYRQLRRMGIPTELHLYPNKAHGAFGFERAIEFMTHQRRGQGRVHQGSRVAGRPGSLFPRGSVRRISRMAHTCESEIESHPDHLFRWQL